MQPAPALAGLADAVTQTAHGAQINWTRIRALLDWLAGHPLRTGEVIAAAPMPSGEDALDCLLAGVAEKLADDARLPRPAWARRVPALAQRWEPVGTPRMLGEARAATPPQLAARNITLAVGDLWRDHG